MPSSKPSAGIDPTNNPDAPSHGDAPCEAPSTTDMSVPGGADRFTLLLGMACFLLLASLLLVDMIKSLLSR